MRNQFFDATMKLLVLLVIAFSAAAFGQELQPWPTGWRATGYVDIPRLRLGSYKLGNFAPEMSR